MNQFSDIAQIIASHLGVTSPEFKGKGAFKETFLVYDNTSKPKALKVFDPEKNNNERTRREIDAMLRCQSNRIGSVEVYNSITVNGKNIFYSLEEFLSGGTLEDHLNANPKSHELTINVIRNISEALTCTKENSLVHRDIKPANIMIRTSIDDLVLVDFGLVRNLSLESLTLSFIPRGPGTPYYMSPEQLNNDKPLITWKSDQFSLGVVASKCLTDQHPFSEPDDSGCEFLSRVAARSKPSKWFVDYMKTIGFEYILKMIDPWPIRRFNSPEEIIQHANGGV